jgi:hypothetical protein
MHIYGIYYIFMAYAAVTGCNNSREKASDSKKNRRRLVKLRQAALCERGGVGRMVSALTGEGSGSQNHTNKSSMSAPACDFALSSAATAPDFLVTACKVGGR